MEVVRESKWSTIIFRKNNLKLKGISHFNKQNMGKICSFYKTIKASKSKQHKRINLKKYCRLWKTAYWMIKMIHIISNLIKSKIFMAQYLIINFEDSILPLYKSILSIPIKYNSNFFFNIPNKQNQMKNYHLNHHKRINRFHVFQTAFHNNYLIILPIFKREINHF